jgi:hypothetical protein
MPRERKYASDAQRQAAYRRRCGEARHFEQSFKGLPALPAIPSIPGWPRWNASIRLAAELLQQTVHEMQQYCDERSEDWLSSDRAEEHHEKTDAIMEVLDLMCDLSG